ncbi:MAG: hypothetical protein JWO56_3681, partial [Acidobacteria bacterium]|nr:hypothetical protein [Acidobacteriota bacterium]
MSSAEQRPRADLSSLKIRRDEENYGTRGFPFGRIIGWAIGLAVLAVLAY